MNNLTQTSNSQQGNIVIRNDVWNPMVKLINEHSDEDVRARAKMLLGQYNTAGGARIKSEL